MTYSDNEKLLGAIVLALLPHHKHTHTHTQLPKYTLCWVSQTLTVQVFKCGLCILAYFQNLLWKGTKRNHFTVKKLDKTISVR